jgi:hypothetical protein
LLAVFLLENQYLSNWEALLNKFFKKVLQIGQRFLVSLFKRACRMKIFAYFLLSLLVWACGAVGEKADYTTEVLVVGGGTGGTAAGIAAARQGAKVIIVEPGPWLGGMISAAGVTCTDGNHHMPSGLWNEFREAIYKVYGGAQAVATGWVSHTQFEPKVSDSIWKSMVKAEPNLTVLHGWHFEKVISRGGKVSGAVFSNDAGIRLRIEAIMCIEATELGDVMANAGVAYSLGMEAGSITDEDVGVLESNDIVQDLTWVATLKDYGKDADCTIVKPVGYNPMEFDGVCTEYYNDKTKKAPNVDAKKMLDYGRLPNGKYMINWPNAGNDAYLNVVNMTRKEREKALEAAKQTTLRFVYFIQTELGFKHLGLADDEFPTEDRLALMPYHREGRRVQGMVRFNIKNLAQPFSYGTPLYRTGISVGDYPIDHHHKKNPAAPQHLDFYPVPSYNIPLGALIPEKETGLIVAEKGISVSNVVNGTTRLQPVVILTGQAAGTLAALSVRLQKAPQQVPVRMVQEALLQQKAYIMPYFDIKPDDAHFDIIQRIGATGLLKGKGEPYQWANRTWFYPDSTLQIQTFTDEINGILSRNISLGEGQLTIEQAMNLTFTVMGEYPKSPGFGKHGDMAAFQKQLEINWKDWGLSGFDLQRPVTRRELAVVLHHSLDPFTILPVDHQGNFIKP